jgi:hypothetical protein
MVKPDKVTLTLSVETTNKTANAALIANSETMDNVLDALKSSGVKETRLALHFLISLQITILRRKRIFDLYRVDISSAIL